MLFTPIYMFKKHAALKWTLASLISFTWLRSNPMFGPFSWRHVFPFRYNVLIVKRMPSRWAQMLAWIFISNGRTFIVISLGGAHLKWHPK